MVEFVSYDGAYPNLCSGQLVLKINEHIETGRWSIDLPEDLEPLRNRIEECINENIPHGCCGGCV